MAEAATATAPISSPLPKVTIQFCTQCKWLLRAAYYAQELLSTFSLSLGEVALQPSTGGTFIVTIHHWSMTSAEGGGEEDDQHASATATVLWDRKVDGGFPETKELKRRVRDVIDPGRDLGHLDRDHRGGGVKAQQSDEKPKKKEKKEDGEAGEAECVDCP